MSDSNDGNKEPFFDFRLFREQKKLNVFVQNEAQPDFDKREKIGPQMVFAGVGAGATIEGLITKRGFSRKNISKKVTHFSEIFRFPSSPAL